MADAQVAASGLQLWGAGCFGGLIGWLLYGFNRQRRDEPTIGDLVTILGAIGGTAILALFPASSDLFGAYGIGLAVGFGLYFLILVVIVGLSDNFSSDWFIDGRKKVAAPPYYIPTRAEQQGNVIPPMGLQQDASRTTPNRVG